jgi:peptide subunit release factor 1 (eRF1)
MLDTELRQLITRGDSSGPFFSVYMDTNRGDESQRDRIRTWIKHEAQRIREALGGNGEVDESVERAVSQIQDYVENSLDPATRGLAVFVCPTEKLFLPLELPVPVEPKVRIGTRPYVRPLMELRQSYPPVLVAMIDAKTARLFELEFGRVLFELDLENPDLPRRHDQGGWSQANMQRHVQDHVNRHHKEVAERLTRLVDQGRVRGVILSGQERNAANFRQYLPKRVEERLAGTLHLDIRSSAEEIIEAALRLLRQRQQESIAERLQSVEEIAQKNGKAVLGVPAVADAVNQRRLETLFLSHGVEAPGWRCTNCRTIGESIPLGCPVCGKQIVTVDLIDEFLSAAETEDAKLEFVPPGSLLDRYQGVGAALRF